MTTHCLNCNVLLRGKFCDNCGQPAGTHRINLHFLWHDIQHGLIHVDKGILFTTRELFTRPGDSIREFLEGKRVRHFKPFSLVIILAGIYGALSHYFHINILASDYQITGSGERIKHVKEGVDRISEWLSQHYSLIAIMQIPIISIGTFLGFRNAGYNFMEHIVINCFVTAQRLILHIVSFPLYIIFNGTPDLRVVDKSLDFIGYALICWTLYQLFRVIPKPQRKWRIMLSLLITLLLTLLVVLGAFEWMFHSIK